MSCSIEIRIILWIYLLNITAVVVRGQTPLPNAVIKINGETMLDCHTTTNDLTLSSWRHSPNGINLITIAVGCNPVTGNDAVYYRTELIGSTNCRLTIANVTTQQAGVYQCFDGASTAYKSLVTVIESTASIVVYNRSEVVDGDQLNISCSLNYSAQTSPAPSLRPSPYWTTTSGESLPSSVFHPSANVVTVTSTVTVHKPTVPVFKCYTEFEITGNISGYNPTPPPDNIDIGSTTEIIVQYGPSIPSSTTEPGVVMINGVSCGISVLTCSNSTGNPVPNYRWFDAAENVILTTTNTLTLAEVNRTYRCDAYNIIRGAELNASTTYTVSNVNCGSTARCCVFPRDETTSITVNGCDNGTSCDCSQGYGGITLTCNAKTFPNSSYMWEGSKEYVTYSPVYEVTKNGMHRCTAYFNEALTNYTGDVKFSNGTNETDVQECCPKWELAISFVIPYIGGNVIVLVVFLVLYFKQSGFTSLMDNRFSGTTTTTIVLLSIVSVFIGLFIIPIVVTVAFCSSLNQGDVASKPGGSIQMDGIPERSGSRQENGDSSAEVSNQQGRNVANAGPGIPGWTIGVMWCVDIVLLFPTTFVAVYFAHCNQMRFEIS